MSAGTLVAKGKSPKTGKSEDVKPAPEGEEVVEYTEHILVPIPFKERLEAIAQRVNQNRRRQKLPKRPLGWFVVRFLQDWMAAVEAGQRDADPAE
jgi:hypothetical protein